MLLTLYVAQIVTQFIRRDSGKPPLALLHRIFLFLLSLRSKSTSKQNRRLVQTMMLIAQSAHTSCLEQETRVSANVLVDPARGESSQYVPVGHDQHVERLRYATFWLADGVGVPALTDVCYERVETLRYLLWRPVGRVSGQLHEAATATATSPGRTYSPPGQPSRQMSHAFSPFSTLSALISLLVTPS